MENHEECEKCVYTGGVCRNGGRNEENQLTIMCMFSCRVINYECQKDQPKDMGSCIQVIQTT